MSVATWLESHPKEIIILACSHLEGMDDRRHESFIFCLKKLFGSKLCPRKVSVLLTQPMLSMKITLHLITSNLSSRTQESVLTLRSLWASGYQVVLSYDDQATERHEELWPDITYWWANQHTAQGLISYLDWKKGLGRPGESV